MRVLLTTDTVGGVWCFTKELSQSLLALGHQVQLVSFGRVPSSAQAQWAGALATRYPASFRYVPSQAPLEWMEENDRCWTEARPVLERALAEFRPDVVHLNQFCFGALETNVARVITAHSDVLSWAESCRSHPLEPSTWLETYCELVQSGLEGADAVAAPSAWMLEALQRNFQVASESMHVIANGRSLPLPLRDGRAMQAVTMGRLWDPGKGLETLLKVRWPFPMLVAGEQQFDAETGPAIATDGMTWLGRLDEEQVILLLQTSSIYVGPSLYEPFGLAPLEAALCGCALVLRDLPSFHEIWSDAALYFSTEDQLQQIVTDLHRNAPLLTGIQSAAAAHAKRYNVEQMTTAYLDLYQEAMNAARDARFAAHVA